MGGTVALEEVRKTDGISWGCQTSDNVFTAWSTRLRAYFCLFASRDCCSFEVWDREWVAWRGSLGMLTDGGLDTEEAGVFKYVGERQEIFDDDEAEAVEDDEERAE